LSKIVIGIHGIGNKPPKELLAIWWKEALLEGLRKNNHSVKDFNFELVYWADILHKTPLNQNETNIESEFYINEPYKPEEAKPAREEMSYRKKALEYLEKYSKKILVNGVLSLNIPSLTELFIHRHLRDLEVYYSPAFILEDGKQKPLREMIIKRLVQALQKHKRKKIFLLAHSMGSIIAYEALKYYSPEIKVEIIATIGSPLGQQFVISKIKSESGESNNKAFSIPGNIVGGWYNFADEEDQVAINHELSKIYKENSSGIKIKDILVQNNYKISEMRNPHKSYGYLRTPEFSSVLNSFLTSRRFELFKWIKNFFRSK
jgi:Lecithin:cholesterol acyltransferase